MLFVQRNDFYIKHWIRI